MEFIPDVDRLSRIFSNAIAPAFFLGAVAAFVSLMMSRLAAVKDRIKAAGALPDQDRSAASAALGLLTRRARLLSHGIIMSLASGICATFLLAILFSTQFFRWSHAYGAALLFIAATLLLGAGLFRFAQEAWHAHRELKE
jgi:hypothetical protein